MVVSAKDLLQLLREMASNGRKCHLFLKIKWSHRWKWGCIFTRGFMGQIQGIKRTKGDGHDGQYDLKMFSFLHHNYQLTGTCGTCGAGGDILHFGWQNKLFENEILESDWHTLPKKLLQSCKISTYNDMHWKFHIESIFFILSAPSTTITVLCYCFHKKMCPVRLFKAMQETNSKKLSWTP